MYKIQIKFNLSQIFLITVATLISTGILVAFLNTIDFTTLKFTSNENLKTFDVDLELSSQIHASNTEAQAAILDASYLETNPDLYILKIKSEKYVTASSLDNFLKKMAVMKDGLVISNASSIKTEQIDVYGKSETKTNTTVNYSALLEKENMDDQQVSHKDLKAVISNNYSIFKKCYEKSLIKDELLSGNATVILDIGKSASVTFKGVGQEQVKNEFKSCIESNAISIKFPSQHIGSRIKFSLFFNS